MSATSFLGSIVASKWERGWPFDHLVVSSDEVCLNSRLHEDRRLVRSDVLSIVVERSRIPLLWRTIIWFRLQHETVGFVPYRARRASRALAEGGWRVS